MSEPFIGEIRVWALPFAPRGWAQCAGQILAISQNQALFSVLGTTYGGDGIQTFRLPDLRGRGAVGADAQHALAQTGGEPFHALTTGEIPSHTHTLQANNTVDAQTNTAFADSTSVLGKSEQHAPQGGSTQPFTPYGAALTNPTNLHPSALATAGVGQAHENRQPYLGLNVCIALEGIFPSRN